MFEGIIKKDKKTKGVGVIVKTDLRRRKPMPGEENKPKPKRHKSYTKRVRRGQGS